MFMFMFMFMVNIEHQHGVHEEHGTNLNGVEFKHDCFWREIPFLKSHNFNFFS